MKKITLILFNLCLFCSPVLFAQNWNQAAALPFGDRYDDVFFLTEDLGWTVSGVGSIFKTEDGGDTWSSMYTNPQYYFRALEFINEDVGFVGSLDSVFLKTEDGGSTWTDIQDLLPVPIKGICGLSHVGDHVFGVGIWSYPAYFIKSEDQGQSWAHQDMSAYADGLVECHFVTKNLGFVAGLKEDVGAVILKTTDGGATWEQVLDTEGGSEYIWKLDFVTEEIAYGVVESFSNPARIVKSIDGGDTWEVLPVATEIIDLQGIGFLNETTGWVGPRNQKMYETQDGGLTWTEGVGFQNINRIFRVSPNLVYASGYQVYKFDNPNPVSVTTPPASTEHGFLSTSPNPFTATINTKIRIDNRTFARLDLFDSAGQRIQNIHVGELAKGEHQFTLELPKAQVYPAGVYFLVLRTNEGFISTTILKENARD